MLAPLLGTLFLGFVATVWLNFISVFIGLAFMGLGVGFTMGAPLNYLVLQAVPKEESATGIATMSLMRSIGLAVSPSILIGFIVQAGKNIQPKLMDLFSYYNACWYEHAGKYSGGASPFKALQNADVTTIVDMVKTALGTIVPEQAKPMVMRAVDSISDKVVITFQTTLNSGYTNMYTVAAIIAALGLLTSLMLKKEKVKD